jgi:hypothetical protein
MSKGNTFENQLLSHVLNNADIADVGDSTGLRGSTTAGSLYVALHTADPGEAGAQNTSEAAYTGYARVAISRAGSAWTVTGNSAVNAAAVTFPECTGGSSTVTHFSVGTAATSTGKVLYYGALSSPSSLSVSSGITPEFAAGTLNITED